MRPMKELLILLKEYVEQLPNDKFMGMCPCTLYMRRERIISLDEELFIDEFTRENRPTDTRFGDITPYNMYFWPYGEKEPRIAFLDHHIKRLS